MINPKMPAPSHNPATKPEPRPSPFYTGIRTPPEGLPHCAGLATASDGRAGARERHEASLAKTETKFDTTLIVRLSNQDGPTFGQIAEQVGMSVPGATSRYLGAKTS